MVHGHPIGCPGKEVGDGWDTDITGFFHPSCQWGILGL